MTPNTTPATPGSRYTFTFAAARDACQDVLDALTDAGHEPRIEYLAGGCAAIRLQLADGSALLISDIDGQLPVDDEPRAPWIALHYPGAWNGYPGDQTPADVYPGPDGATRENDTAAMLAAVTAYAHTH